MTQGRSNMTLMHLRATGLACLGIIALAVPAGAQQNATDSSTLTVAGARRMALIAAAAVDGLSVADDGQEQADRARDSADRAREAADRARANADRERDRETRVYEQARALMDDAKYDRAILMFT